jgi:type I restriction enzyme, S subunit
MEMIDAEVTRVSELLDRLKRQTLAKAFRGELASQDPKDENASALLERIWNSRRTEVPEKRKMEGQSAHT